MSMNIKETLTIDTGKLIDDLLGDLEPPTEETFVIEIGPKKRAFHFRVLKTAAEVSRFKTAAVEFQKLVRNTKQLPEEWEEFLPLPPSVVNVAFIIHYFSVEPTKISQLQALQLMQIGWIWDSVIEKINRNQFQATLSSEVEEIEEAKKD